MTKHPGCPSNIGEKEKQKRLLFAWMMLVVSVISLFALHNTTGRMLLFIPVFFSCLGFIQVKQKLCVFYGFRGTQNLDTGEKKVEDPSLAQILRKTSGKIVLLSAGIAASVTLIFLLIP